MMSQKYTCVVCSDKKVKNDTFYVNPYGTIHFPSTGV